MTMPFPLQWPAHRPRTPPGQRRSSPFRTAIGAAIDNLYDQLDLLRAIHVVISTNIQPRRDGRPRVGQANPDDPGVAVYFMRGERQYVFACDRFALVAANIHANGKTIEAIRGIERWGAKEMMDQAFTGFEALPAPGQAVTRPWWMVLGFGSPGRCTGERINEAYRRLARERHPDNGGSAAAMAELNAAREAALREIGT